MKLITLLITITCSAFGIEVELPHDPYNKSLIHLSRIRMNLTIDKNKNIYVEKQKVTVKQFNSALKEFRKQGGTNAGLIVKLRST